MQDQAHLLKSRRFLPLFLVQFLGAFNDNIFKNALVILITYRAAAEAGISGALMVTLAAGIFILPFFIFSAIAGQLADGCEKSGLIRWIKLAEILIMALGAAAFWMGDIYLLLGILFLMGTQSAFFGPLKYAILPDHLEESELIAGNGLIEGATFIAILLGTIVGSLLILVPGGVIIISVIVLVVAGLGYWASRVIPPTLIAAPRLHLRLNIAADTWAMMTHAARQRGVFMAIIGISWFWLLGATFLAQFPNYTKLVVGGNEQVVVLFLTAFAIGIAAGSLMCNRLLKGRISVRYVPLAAIAMTVFIIDLYFAMRVPAVPPAVLMGATDFLSHFANLRVLADFVLIAVAGGIYVVPLYALIQDKSEDEHRARAIASLNVMNSLFMVASAVVTMGLFVLGLDVSQVFLVVGIVNLAAAFYMWRLSKLEDAAIISD